MTITVIPIADFHAALKAQGVPQIHAAVICPMCGTIQSAHDLITAGAGQTFDDVAKYIGFSCVGRWTHRKPPPAIQGTQDGCNWTLGGLFQCHTLEVLTPDAKRHPAFEVATPAQAQANMRKQ